MKPVYDEKIIPLPSESYRWFEEALIKASPLNRLQVKKILRQCWRDIHNA